MFNIHSDMIRGNIETAVLKCLFEGDKYGFEICKDIEDRTHGQYTLKQPTLYSCLARLEAQGLVTFYWQDNNDKGAKRKYYRLTEEGRAFFTEKQTQWEYSRTVIDKMISDNPFDLEALKSQSDLEKINTSSDNESFSESSESNLDESINKANEEEEFIFPDSDSEDKDSEQTVSSNFDEDEDSEQTLSSNFDEDEDSEQIVSSDLDEDEDSEDNISFAEPKEEFLADTGSIETPKDAELSQDEPKEHSDESEIQDLSWFSAHRNLNIPSYSDSILSQTFSKKAKPVSQSEIFDEVFYNIKDTGKSDSPDEIYNEEQNKTSVLEEFDLFKQSESENQFEKKSEELFEVVKKKFSPDGSSDEPSTFVFYNSQKSEEAVKAEEQKAQAKANERFAFKTDPNEYIDSVTKNTSHTKDYKTILSKIAGINGNSYTGNTYTNSSFGGSTFTNASHQAWSKEQPNEKYSQQSYFSDIGGKTKIDETESFQDEPLEPESLFDENKNIRVRSHSKETSKDYNNMFYVYSNKIRLIQYPILGTLILLQTLFVYLSLVVGMGLTGDLWLYTTAVVFAVLLSVAGVVLYFYNPKKVHRVDATGRIFITRLFITIFSILLVVVINVLNEKTIFASVDYLSRLILPSVICLNILIADIVFIFMYRTKKFSY